MHKCVQNVLCNSGPDAALEGTLDGGLNVGFWMGTLEFSLKAIEDVE